MKVGQSKLQSFLESIVNILVGFGVALGSQIVIFPLYGIEADLRMNVEITIWFTFISLIRSYLLRRAFNWWHVKQRRK